MSNRLSSLIKFLLIVVLLSGCTSPAASQAQPTTAPPTAAPPTAAVPPTAAPATAAGPSGAPISANGVEFIIPAGLGTAASAETVAEVADTQTGPGWDVAPVHYKFSLQGYPIPGEQFVTGPTILIYPAQEYAQVHQAAAVSIERLRTIFLNPASSLAKQSMPNIPYLNAALAMASNMKVIPFQGGSGVRMLAYYAQGPAPVTNQYLAYHFHGLSADGKYYVIVMLPITASFLQQDSNTPLPADGVPFPLDMAANDAYLDQIAGRLNTAETGNTLSLSITVLDSLVQSIKLNAPAIVPPAPAVQQPAPTVAQPTQAPVAACDAAQFIADVSVPDGTSVKAGETFVKTWRLQNAGTCTWDSNYAVVVDNGKSMTQATGYPFSKVASSSAVAPGQMVDISIPMEAPAEPGTYTTYWRLQNSSEAVMPVYGGFQGKLFSVQIKVGGNGSSSTGQITKVRILKVVLRQGATPCTGDAQYNVAARIASAGPVQIHYTWDTGSNGNIAVDANGKDYDFSKAETATMNTVVIPPYDDPGNVTIILVVYVDGQPVGQDSFTICSGGEYQGE